MGKPSDLAQRALDLLILKTFFREAKHGRVIASAFIATRREARQLRSAQLCAGWNTKVR